MDAGIVLVLVFIISYYVYRVVSSWSSFEARFKRRLEDRRAAILDRSSRRVNKVLDLLDMDNLGDDMMELMEGQRYIRCAVIMSREAAGRCASQLIQKPTRKLCVIGSSDTTKMVSLGP